MISKVYQRDIAAPTEVVFDLCRSIDFHLEAAQSIQARAIGGTTSGLAEDGTVTIYSALFYGLRFKLTMKVSGYRPPFEFRDRMTNGLFEHFSHHYQLTATPKGCRLQDTFSFAAPFGTPGNLFARVVIAPALQKAQQQRLNAIQIKAEQ